MPRQMQARFFWRTGVILAFIAGASACGPTVIRPDDAPQQETLAEQASMSGDHRAAAQKYDDLARRASGYIRTRYLLRAGREWYAAGDRARARRNLVAAKGPFDDSANMIRAPLAARLAIDDGNFDQALDYLAEIPRNSPAHVLTDAATVRADAYFGSGRPGDAVNAMLEAETWLNSPDEIRAHYRLIWDGLARSNIADIQRDIGRARDPVMRGWLSLGLIAAGAQNNQVSLKADLNTWRSEYPGHPASTTLVSDVLKRYRADMQFPGKLALLLPLSGNLQGAGTAIRDGFLAAWYRHDTDDPNGNNPDRPQIQVYDTVQNGAVDAYRQALIDGADFIIGPLSKQNAASIADANTGETLVLVLNYLPENIDANGVFQFALAPEDEARQAAERIIEDGLVRGVALVPADEWGLRLLNTFNQRMYELGGTLLDHRVYDPQSQDYTAPITSLLHLDDSQRRERTLADKLDLNIQFEPRRRQDTQFVFIAARSRQAQRLQPQLDFHYANDLPVYATSSVFEPGQKNNKDLDGIVFPDMPWVMGNLAAAQNTTLTIDEYWPGRGDRRARLYAMGFDAYRLVPALHNQEQPLDIHMQGVTGVLSMDENLRIHRQLKWARIENGRPIPLIFDEDLGPLAGMPNEQEELD